jgi:hypothetical protein
MPSVDPYAITELRSMVRLFGRCNESFNQRWTLEELTKIYEAYHACEWDILPDAWPANILAHVIEYGPGEVFGEMCAAAFADDC